MEKADFGKLIAANVEGARLRAGYTVRGLAKRAGLSTTPVQRLCWGKSPQVSLFVMARVADVLDLSLDRLAGRDSHA